MKNTKLYVGIAFGSMVILSVWLAWEMSQNMGNNTSKDRFRITKAFKKYKDIPYEYDEKRGAKLNSDLCMKCHRADGMGSGNFPSLVDSPLLKDKTNAILVVSHGLKGELIRGEKKYNGKMPGYKIMDAKDLADVLNYVRQRYQNNPELITTIEVLDTQMKHVEKKGAWTEADLKQLITN